MGKTKNQDKVVNYAMDYLDKIAAMNKNGDDNIVGEGINLGDY
jgi:hypothetical protein